MAGPVSIWRGSGKSGRFQDFTGSLDVTVIGALIRQGDDLDCQFAESFTGGAVSRIAAILTILGMPGVDLVMQVQFAALLALKMSRLPA